MASPTSSTRPPWESLPESATPCREGRDRGLCALPLQSIWPSCKKRSERSRDCPRPSRHARLDIRARTQRKEAPRPIIARSAGGAGRLLPRIPAIKRPNPPALDTAAGTARAGGRGQHLRRGTRRSSSAGPRPVCPPRPCAAPAGAGPPGRGTATHGRRGGATPPSSR